MTRKKKSGEDGTEDLVDRIVLLGDLLCDGNQSEMARVLGVDQSAISRIVKRQQQPNVKLVEGLAKQPRVNIHWLFTGIGQPLVEQGIKPEGRLFRPVADQLLPGSPADHPGLLTPGGYPVADPFFSETNYFYRVPPRAAIAKRREADDLLIKVHDLILVETAEAWTRKAQAVAGKLCVVNLKIGRRERLVLAEVFCIPQAQTHEDDFDQYAVKVYYETDQDLPKVWLIVPWTGAFQKSASEPANTRKALRKRIASKLPPEDILLGLEDVAGVCVKLERNLGS